MCDSGFRESSTSVLLPNHDDPAAVERLVIFLYAGNYDSGVSEADGRSSVGAELMPDTLVYAITGKYDVENLKAGHRTC